MVAKKKAVKPTLVGGRKKPQSKGVPSSPAGGTVEEVMAKQKDGRKTRGSRGRVSTKGTPKRKPGEFSLPVTSPGYTLLKMLFDKQKKDNLTVDSLAKNKLGVTGGYLTHLRNGSQSPESLSREVLEKVAAYLEIPYVAAMLYAGKLLPKDYYVEVLEGLEEQIEHAMEFIRHDPDWGPFMPSEIFTASMQMRQFAVLCYEKATDRRLIPGKLDLPGLLAEMRAAEEEAEAVRPARRQGGKR